MVAQRLVLGGITCRKCRRQFIPLHPGTQRCDECRTITTAKQRNTEAAEQRAFIAHVRKRGDMPVAACNGAALAGGYKSWARLKGMGAASGFPDVEIHGPVGKPSLFVEMKQPGRYMTTEQREWRDHLVELGHTHVLARSAMEAIDAYERWRTEVRG